MLNILKYFPEGIAMGNAFLNREKERIKLAERINANKHTVLMAPRRYGKTSLVMKVASDMKTPHCAMDFLAAYSEEYVRDQIIDKVSRLVFTLLPKVNKAKQQLITIFKKMKPEISIGLLGQKLSLSLSNSPLQDITEVLLRLDETAKHFKKRAVIFLDEFQQISQLKNHHSIEACIRHAVERSENIAYVFSGSNRRLLTQMFGEQSRPLYRLCQTITIERMTEEVYTKQLQLLAKLKWKQPLSKDTIAKIFELAELHPFYMNVLCQLLWEENSMVNIEKTENLWRHYVESQKYIISQDITALSANQRLILTALAKSPTKEIQSAQFTTPLKISASSAQQAAQTLLYKDLIYTTHDGFYNVLDPAIKYYLNIVLWSN